MTSSRVLCLDLGTRRVGVAVSDPLGMTAQPLPPIHFKQTDTLCRDLKTVLTQYDPSIIVVGLPLTLSGQEGPAVRRTRTILQTLQPVLENRQVIEWDERLTTSAAERVLLEGNVSRQKRQQHIDSLAASLILQAYLGAHPVRL